MIEKDHHSEDKKSRANLAVWQRSKGDNLLDYPQIIIQQI